MSVQIFHRVQSGPGAGMKLEKAMGRTMEAQSGLMHEARKKAIKANATLNGAKERTGSAFIEIERGNSDVYVTLNDPGGAANIIEFGRHPHAEHSTASYAVAPLGHAFGPGIYKTFGRKSRGV